MRRLTTGVVLSLLLAGGALARIGGGDIVYDVKHIGKVTFRHDSHVETMGFFCSECHPLTFGTVDQHKTFKMSHRRQAQSCGSCHNGERAFDLKTNCNVCHQREGK